MNSLRPADKAARQRPHRPAVNFPCAAASQPRLHPRPRTLEPETRAGGKQALSVFSTSNAGDAHRHVMTEPPPLEDMADIFSVTWRRSSGSAAWTWCGARSMKRSKCSCASTVCRSSRVRARAGLGRAKAAAGAARGASARQKQARGIPSARQAAARRYARCRLAAHGLSTPSLKSGHFRSEFSNRAAHGRREPSRSSAVIVWTTF